jgi:glutathione synthase/RimK-type ligase-like ATP-grasp enzyme
MKDQLAIHDRQGSYSDRWITYCEEHRIAYKVVNCFASDIIQQLAGASGLLWHWTLNDPSEQLIARQILQAIEVIGIPVFPNNSTCWHYNDKIGQKYLLEAIGAPLVPTHVFYNLADALCWINKASFPKVFKLSKGGGSTNVRLARNAREAGWLAKRVMTTGFSPIAGYTQDVQKRFRIARKRGDLFAVLKRMPEVLAKIRQFKRDVARERGYVYFQDFIPGNDFDTRITIIGNRAFGFTRNVRPRDFRASGSGDINYDVSRVHMQCVRTAFGVAQKIGSQSLAFDFVLDEKRRPLILEVSYCYDPRAVHGCQGHWDEQLNWHPGHMWPQDAILTDFLEKSRDANRHPKANQNPITPFGPVAAKEEFLGR